MANLFIAAATAPIALMLLITLGLAGENEPPILPTFVSANFEKGAAIDNPYFPVLPGMKMRFVGSGAENGRTVVEQVVLTYAGGGPTILGLPTTTLLDESYENELLIEKALDYCAQDKDGNVWYLGEDVTNYVYDKNRRLIETNNSSTWRGGVNGALPGYIMLASPKPGLTYFQEHAPQEEAMDYGKIVDVEVTISTPGTTYGKVVKIFEGSTIDDNAGEFKYYASGIGNVRIDEGLSLQRTNPEMIVNLVTNSHSDD